MSSSRGGIALRTPDLSTHIEQVIHCSLASTLKITRSFDITELCRLVMFDRKDKLSSS
jgi:hypothetical protein